MKKKKKYIIIIIEKRKEREIKMKIILFMRIFGYASLILYIIFALKYQFTAFYYSYVRFTFKQLKPFVLLDRIHIYDDGSIALRDKNDFYIEDDICLYFYFDYLRLKCLVNYYKKNKKKIEFVQKMQSIVNEQYEEIESEIVKK